MRDFLQFLGAIALLFLLTQLVWAHLDWFYVVY